MRACAGNHEKAGGNMLKIRAEYSGRPVIKTPLRSIDDVYRYMEYEAELTIESSGGVFFSEEVAIVEFYWYISRWYRAVTSGGEEDFAYSTVEHTEPILTFSHSGDKTWTIDSIWGKCSPIAVGEKDLLEQVSGLIDKVEASFKSDIQKL